MSELKVITLFRQLLDAMSYINKLSNSHSMQISYIETSNLITFFSTKMRNSRLQTSDWLAMWRSR